MDILVAVMRLGKQLVNRFVRNAPSTSFFSTPDLLTPIIYPMENRVQQVHSIRLFFKKNMRPGRPRRVEGSEPVKIGSGVVVRQPRDCGSALAAVDDHDDAVAVRLDVAGAVVARGILDHDRDVGLGVF